MPAPQTLFKWVPAGNRKVELAARLGGDELLALPAERDAEALVCPDVRPSSVSSRVTVQGQLLVFVCAGEPCTAGTLWLIGTLTLKSLRVGLPAASFTRSVTT